MRTKISQCTALDISHGVGRYGAAIPVGRLVHAKPIFVHGLVDALHIDLHLIICMQGAVRVRLKEGERIRVPVRKIVIRIIQRLVQPVIDILINNEGTIMRIPTAEHPDEY